MLAGTHIKIAQTVLDEAIDLGVVLNGKWYVVGNVIPDFSPYHKTIGHYRESSIEFMESWIKGIMESRSVKEKSFRLGIVSHYLSDYFCSPHYNNLRCNSRDALEHIIYEKELNKYTERYILDKYSVDTFDSITEIIDASTGDYINTQTFKYDLNTSISTLINLLVNIRGWGTSNI